jgi:hypothetical protein
LYWFPSSFPITSSEVFLLGKSPLLILIHVLRRLRLCEVSVLYLARRPGRMHAQQSLKIL